MIVPWDEVADSSIHPRPHIIMPSGIEESKPRHFVDGWWLNLMMARYPFRNGCSGQGGANLVAWGFSDDRGPQIRLSRCAVGKGVLAILWIGEARSVLRVHDAVFWVDMSPYIYHSLLDVGSRYLRTKGLPMVTWIDDFYFANRRSIRLLEKAQQRRAAEAAAYLVMTTFHQAGCCM